MAKVIPHIPKNTHTHTHKHAHTPSQLEKLVNVLNKPGIALFMFIVLNEPNSCRSHNTHNIL